MARPLFWLGIPGYGEGKPGSNAVVVVRTVINGVVLVDCNGRQFTGMADTATQDGLVRILVRGLTPDTSYPYTVTLPNGDSGSAVLKTFPRGNVPPKIAWFSCCNGGGNLPYITIENQDPHCVICLGDFGYMSGGFSWPGYPGKSVDENTVSASDYHQALRAHHAKSYFRRMAEKIPFAHVPDDHEWDINNVNWPTVSGNLANIDAFAEGIHDYMIGNPKNKDNTGDTNPFYFRFRCGRVEVFVLCAVMHGKDPADVQRMVRDDGAAGQANCLGRDATGTDIRNQEEWLTSCLKVSRAEWKLVLMPKQTLKSTNVNADSWSTYRVEMDRTLQTIHDDDSLKKSKLGGIVWGCGDWHSPGIHGSEAGVNGDTYDHIAITPCPLVGAVRDAGPPSAHTIFSYNGLRQPTGSDLDFYGLFGLFEPRRELAAASIMNFRGDVLASIDIRRRENKAMR